MIELVLTICLLDDAQKCRDESLVFADASVLACVMAGQPIAAQYMELRPRWYISRWACRQAGQFAKA